MADARRPKPDRSELPPPRERGGGGGPPRPVPPVVPPAPAAPAKPPPPPSPGAPARPAAAVPPAKPVAPVVPGKPAVAAAPVPPAAPARPAPPRAPAAAPPPAGPDPLVGQTIGRCRILGRVGVGRTAVVYRAHHEGLGRDVAVKILQPAILAFPEIVAKFEQEARAIARLDHANVLKIYDVVTEGDRRGIVMEFLEGESVLEFLQREGRVDPVDALRIVRQAAAGLQAAHAKGIIHRDVKPQNLVILEDGTVKLVDFGLAAAAESDLAAGRIGTPHYMSPEVCGAKPAEPASDVYSLGITLYHLLTGKPPYAGMGIKEILAAHVAAKPLAPEKVVKGMGEPLADLVRGMTAREPSRRLSVDQVIDALDRIGGDDLVKHLRLKPRSARHRRVVEGRERRRRSAALPLLLIGAAVAGLLIFLLSRGHGGKEPPAPGPSTAGAPPAPTPAEPAPPSPRPGPAAPKTRTPVPKEPTPAAPTTEPPATPEAPSAPGTETDAQRREREEAARQAERAARAEESKKAFADAEEFARQRFEDKGAVVARYREVAREFTGTDAGREAKRRADGIEKGEIHPHPERSFAAKSAVDAAREAWDAAKAQVEQALSTYRYDDALHLMPASVDDPQGKLGPELSLWRDLARDLGEFFPTLAKEAGTLKGDDRSFPTPKGKGRIVRFSMVGPQVQVGSDVLDVRWTESTPADIADLAARAFRGKDMRLQELLAEFAWAHRVRDVFFQAAISVKTAGASGLGSPKVDALLARADERLGR